jgi:signal transduction histidine kinase
MEEVQAAQQELARAHQRALVECERDRRRLAHDLHDDVVQRLIGIHYFAEQHQQGINGQELDARQVEVLETIRQEVLDVVRRLRRLIGTLRPAGLEELGLTAALEEHVRHLQHEAGSTMPVVEMNLDESKTNLAEPVAICLFRAAQEAIRNVLNHARARYLTLSLHLTPDTAMLNVCDDGCGFRVPARLSELARADHFGLVGIAERVAWVGGQVTIQSQPGAGTCISVHIPLKGTEQNNDRNDSSPVG